MSMTVIFLVLAVRSSVYVVGLLSGYRVWRTERSLCVPVHECPCQSSASREDLNGMLGTVVAAGTLACAAKRSLSAPKLLVVQDRPDEFGRIYVDVGGKTDRARVLKVLPDRLQEEGIST